jgi:hypothetical protein
LGIGDWGLGPIPNPQSPIPNPQSPFKFSLIDNIHNKIILLHKLLVFIIKLKLSETKYGLKIFKFKFNYK